MRDALDTLLGELRAMPAKEVEQVVELSGLARSLVWKFRYEGHAIRAQTAIRIEDGVAKVKAARQVVTDGVLPAVGSA